MRTLKALLAGVALTVIVVGVPWALLRYIGNPWPAEGIAPSAPLTDGAIVGLLAVIVWVLWAQLVACILVEAIAALSDDHIQVEVPFALGLQQHLARRLVTAVVVATVATPVAAAAVVATKAEATPPAPAAAPDAVGPAGSTEKEQASPHDQSGRVSREAGGPTTAVTVMRLDSLWSIAERHLGDGHRWPEIAALNEGRTMKDGTRFVAANHIRPGWELHVPVDPGAIEGRNDTSSAGSASGPAGDANTVIGRTVTVEKGDTLSEIALKELGDDMAYPALFEATKDVNQPTAAQLTDPDLILPGWTIVIPSTRRDDGGVTSPETHEADRARPGAGGPDGSTPGPRIDPGRTVPRSEPVGQDPEPANASSSASAEPNNGVESNHGDELTFLQVLLGSAACLSAGALGIVLTNRRRQFRRRRVGRTIASTPAGVVEVEQAIVEHGTAAQDAVTFLDRALRHVAASCRVGDQPLPALGAAVLDADELTLLFTQAATSDVPDGWTATDDAVAWTLPRSTILEDDLETQPAPYPALVSIGQDDDDRTWMLDLETLGTCGIAGAPHDVADLVRFMVAELAVNAWSEGSDVLLVDPFGAETIGLNPARLRQVSRSDALARAGALAAEADDVEQTLGADLLSRRRDGVLLDTTHPVVVVVADRLDDPVAEWIEARDRSRMVVVHADDDAPAVVLSGDGAVFLPRWGVRVKAFTLPTSEASAMAALLAATRVCDDDPVPVTQSNDGPLGPYARADGSLREEYTEPRDAEGGNPSSVLPGPDAVYLAAAATTANDLAAAAPRVAEAIRVELATLDPTLDDDVTDWFDESCPRPKVHLLGPVEVTSLKGGDPAALDNLGATVSFIAFLACQDHGVTGERAAAACGWKTQRTVQNRATNARFLLGTRPDGTDWLPDASVSAAARRGSSPTYELTRGPGGVLNSADLFVRLRHRAARRGDRGGCEQDLVTALSLVTGAPFEAATEYRFRWLFKPGQQRYDEILVGAIHDTAHVLATRALADGRTDMVRLACAAARTASPHSDMSWLDEAAATQTESGREAAVDLVRQRVLERFDEDLPSRSQAVVEQRNWGAAG